MNEVKWLLENPRVFRIVDFEMAVWRDTKFTEVRTVSGKVSS